MAVDARLVAGYVIARAVRTALPGAGRQPTEPGLDRLHQVVTAKLGPHPVLDDLAEEAARPDGQVSELTRQQLELAVTAAARRDGAFGQAVTELVTQLHTAEQARGAPVVAGPGAATFAGDAHVDARDGGVAVGQVGGNVNIGRDPAGQRPDPPGVAGAAVPRSYGFGVRGGVGIGHIAGNAEFHLYPVAPGEARPVRSAYLQQVARIAPPRLRDRDAELAELAGFCLDDHRGPYVWWRAGPWAGKSALLSTFVRTPPPELADRVRLVSFFITARLAGQDTRDAFTTVLTEQLCELTRRDLPSAADEATREAVLLELLEQAATACQADGARLVLVVDGLDEDRSLTVGAHSIAGLLPASPPAGMRVIVAGRPNPPIPDDVEAWHPLRDDGIIRLLGDSPHARDLQQRSQAELKRLLNGSGAEQDLLGLLTAARGGLSGPDLRELTGADLVQIEGALHTVAGRTFTRRVATWSPESSPEIYLLGHEELQHAAVQYLGRSRLTGYQQRLHAWAATYRSPRDGREPWPDTTPEYLLRGYARMLETTGDGDRLVALVTDLSRHNRMLDVSGGDAAAVAEIEAAHGLLMAGETPDLLAVARLSMHRRRLDSRNVNISTDLPAVWALIGEPTRAEALARGFTDPDRQAEALAGVAEAVAGTGDLDHAVRIVNSLPDPARQIEALAKIAAATVEAGDLDRAAQIARDIPDPGRQAEAVAKVAAAAVAAGDLDRAAQIARDIPDPNQQAKALLKVTEAAVSNGDPRHALRVADSITTDAYLRAAALTSVAEAAARTGDLDHAEQIASSIPDPFLRVGALTAVAAAAAGTGRLDQARHLAVDAERIAHRITHPHSQASALASVVNAAVSAGDLDHAEQVADSIAEPENRVKAIAAVAKASSSIGDHARRLIADAETMVHEITGPWSQRWAVEKLVEAAMSTGDLDDAVRIAHSLADLSDQAEVLATIAEAAAGAGDLDRAEGIAESTGHSSHQLDALRSVAEAAISMGDRGRAERIARSAAVVAAGKGAGLMATATAQGLQATVAAAAAGIGDLADVARIVGHVAEPDRQALMLAQTAARTDDLACARQLITDAERVARGITNSYDQGRVLASVAEASANIGDADRAARIAHSITDGGHRKWAMAKVIDIVARTGDLDHAQRLAYGVSDRRPRADALTSVAGAAARNGGLDRARRLAADAERTARGITDPDRQAETLADVARATAAAGDTDRAQRIARAITDPARRARTLAGIAATVADIGDVDRAAQIANGITESNQRTEALAKVAKAIAGTGNLDRAVKIATSISSTYVRTDVLIEIADAAARTGDLERALRIARAVTEPYRQVDVLTMIAEATAGEGNLSESRRIAAYAESIARGMSHPHSQADALTDVARAVATAGDLDGAERIARSVSEPYFQGRVLNAVAKVLATSGDLDGAERIARSITDPAQQAETLAGVAEAAADVDDLDRAERVTNDAVRIGLWIESQFEYKWVEAASRVAAAAARTGDLDVAERIARSIPDPRAPRFGQSRVPDFPLNEALASVAEAAATSGDLDRAERIAQSMPDRAMYTTNRADSPQGVTLTSIAMAAARAGDVDRAERVARSIPDRDGQARALAGIAEVVGHPAADRLLGAAFGVGSWLIPLPVLAKLQPNLVVQIADEVQHADARMPAGQQDADA
ncbi:hypothetical protein GCM10027610_081630 [Dactylosporangium cerinum]